MHQSEALKWRNREFCYNGAVTLLQNMKFFYQCSECGKEFDITPELMVCPVCSGEQQTDEPLRGILEVGFEGQLPEDFKAIDFLPVEQEYFPAIPVGNTPLWQPERLREKLGFLPNTEVEFDISNPLL